MRRCRRCTSAAAAAAAACHGVPQLLLVFDLEPHLLSLPKTSRLHHQTLIAAGLFAAEEEEDAAPRRRAPEQDETKKGRRRGEATAYRTGVLCNGRPASGVWTAWIGAGRGLTSLMCTRGNWLWTHFSWWGHWGSGLTFATWPSTTRMFSFPFYPAFYFLRCT